MPERLRELAWLFLKLGTTGFGGPAAHIAMMEEEVVRRRGWMSRETFLDYIGATNLIPGPNSTEMAIHVGHARAGWPGLVVAGVCFIVPAAVLITVLAWAYVTYGAMPDAARLLYGIKPVIMAVVIVALWGLARSAVKHAGLGALGAAAIVATAMGAHELLVLAAGALVAVAARQARSIASRASAFWIAAAGAGGGVSLGAASFAATAAATTFGLVPLFLVFFKAGALLFGSGYVLLAFLRADLVERLAWLTEAQLLDAIAIGQMMPGPVFTTATFIGYVLGGLPGALIATLGIFVPAFFFVAVSGPLIPRLRRSRIAGAALDGVNVASLALMAVVTWHLGRAALVDGWTIALALVALVAIIRFKVNSAWLIAAGAIVGWLVG